MTMIAADGVIHVYDAWKGDEKFQRTALDGVSLDVAEGEFVAILGSNGSGKSTFAKHLNVLLLPTKGEVRVDGKDTRDEANLWRIRDLVGMVFQNPDNQIIGANVEEDVAFGPECKNVPPGAIRKKVADSLRAVGLLAEGKTPSSKLSGGQKQRVAIAGVLAADSPCIVLDEPTSMLDPAARRSLIQTLHELHHRGKTIILITHNIEEAAGADRVLLMAGGHVLSQGKPEVVFGDAKLVENAGMELPRATQLGNMLVERKVVAPRVFLFEDDLVDALVERFQQNAHQAAGAQARKAQAARHLETTAASRNAELPSWNNPISPPRCGSPEATDSRPALGCEDLAKPVLLEMRQVSYSYGGKATMEKKVLDGVSLKIRQGEFLGIAGTSGSGKTTLIKHLNGLLKATSGDVLFDSASIYAKKYPMSSLRKQVGLVFQYPESQLFCKSVIEDVSFGPKQMGLTDDEALRSAERSLRLVGIEPDCNELSPFDLSGGQMRRVAIAGVLAMDPAILVMDEPAAGLDPQAKMEVFELIDRIRRERNLTVVLVSHDMEDLAEHADRMVILHGGRIAMEGTPEDVFGQVDKVRSLGLDVPLATSVCYRLAAAGMPLPSFEVGLEAAADSIVRAFESGSRAR